MPDPNFTTLSSSQIPSLLNISTWGTRLTLWNGIKNRIPDDRKQDIRMEIGKVFEALILKLTAEKLALEIVPNAAQEYIRHETYPLGCTVDASIFCPTRGHGTIEAKAVDKFQWQSDWTEHKAPAMYEAQLQQQMIVKGDTWGAIACFIYNEPKLVIYERRPIMKAQNRIIKEVETFFASIEANQPPPAFGLPVEIDCLNQMFPEAVPEKVIDALDNVLMAETARMYRWVTQEAASFKRAADEYKPKIMQFMGDAGFARLATGIQVRSAKSTVAGQVVMLPADLRNRLREAYSFVLGSEVFDGQPETHAAAILEALDWAHIVRQPGTQNRLEIIDPGSEVAIPETPSMMEAG